LIRPKQDVFPSGLLWRFLKQENTMQLMGERVVQAVQANLSLGTLSDTRLVLPPKGLTMKLFEIAIAAIDESKALNSQKIRVLSESRDTLLPRLISGQIDLNIL
jgi:type I restriction enzyme S subunit